VLATREPGMPQAKKRPTRATSDTFAERKTKFESKQINVARERADHRRNSKTVAKKGDRGDQKRRKTKKTARKKR
jgi:hypothetical protein